MLNSIDSFHGIMLITMVNNLVFKVPLLWVMKRSYFGFGSPQQQVDMHARSKNTRSKKHFSKPLLCVTLICGDWSISFKAVFVSF